MGLQELGTTERLNHHSVYMSIPISHFIPPANLLVTMFVCYIFDSRKRTLGMQWLRESISSCSLIYSQSHQMCLTVCRGSLGNLVHWSKGVRVSECCVTGCPLMAPGKQIQHDVYWRQCSNSAVVCAARQMISELGHEASQAQCKCHNQCRNWAEYCARFVPLIFEFSPQLDLQNTFIILVVWWKYCLPDFHKNWLQERLILGCKRTKSFP